MKIIFSDLDGTLLDHSTYSVEKAEEALAKIKSEKIPLVLVSSKTRKEIEFWQKNIGINQPFISENGGGIFIPKKYFSFFPDQAVEAGNYFLISFSPGIKEVKQKLRKAIKENEKVRLFSEMSLEEIISETGLTKSQAEKAKEREFDEAFIIDKGNAEEIAERVRKEGLTYTDGGRFHHVMQGHDKGKAVKILLELFEKEFGKLESLGLGDSENDFEMLRSVSRGVLVKKYDGSYESEEFEKAQGIGPEGWNTIVLTFLKN